MLRAGLITAFLAAAGCGTGDLTPPDAGPDRDAEEIPEDGSKPGDGGLLFEIELKPSLPGDIGGGIDGDIDEVEILLEDVRAIGEAAPGDARTTLDMILLQWLDSNKEEIFFPEAPVGMYARFLAEAVDINIEGELDLDDDDTTETPFDIEITDPQSIMVDITGVEVVPGETTRVKIEFDARDVVRLVDWNSIEPDDGGELEVHDDSPFYDDVIDAFVNAFEPRLGDTGS